MPPSTIVVTAFFLAFRDVSQSDMMIMTERCWHCAQVWPMKIIKVAMQNNEPGWYPPPGENNQTAKYTLTELGLCPRDVPPRSAYTWYAIHFPHSLPTRTSLCSTSGDMAV